MDIMNIMNLTEKDIDVKLIQIIYPMEDEINFIIPNKKDLNDIKEYINGAVSPNADIYYIGYDIAHIINKNYNVYDIIIDCPNYLAKALENALLDYGISILYPVYKNNKIIQLIKSCNYR